MAGHAYGLPRYIGFDLGLDIESSKFLACASDDAKAAVFPPAGNADGVGVVTGAMKPWQYRPGEQPQQKIRPTLSEAELGSWPGPTYDF